LAQFNRGLFDVWSVKILKERNWGNFCWQYEHV